jgi:hypothetical protein
MSSAEPIKERHAPGGLEDIAAISPYLPMGTIIIPTDQLAVAIAITNKVICEYGMTQCADGIPLGIEATYWGLYRWGSTFIGTFI